MGLAVKPAYALALKRVVADHPEQTLRAPPLHFRRRPPQSNYPPDIVLLDDIIKLVSYPNKEEWYLNNGSARTGVLASKPPTYPAHLYPNSSVKL